MNSFKDSEGRAWVVTVDVAAMKRVRSMTGVDLYRLVADGAKGLGDLLGDPIKLADVLYCLCRDQAKALSLSDEDFGRLLAGDVFGDAADAFVDGLVSFFPDPKARKALRELFEKGKIASAMVLEHSEKQMAGITPEKMAADVIRASESKRSSTSLPAPSASTPDL